MMQSKFAITVSSELMAILAIVTDLADLRKRLGEITVAYDKQGKPGHHRRLGSCRSHGRLDAQHHQPHPVQHGGISALHGARRALRQHRRGAVLHHRRPAGPEDVRLPRHGERLRGRHRLREILERQVPLQRAEAQRLRADHHHSRAQDARWRPARRSRLAARRRIHQGKSAASGERAFPTCCTTSASFAGRESIRWSASTVSIPTRKKKLRWCGGRWKPRGRAVLLPSTGPRVAKALWNWRTRCSTPARKKSTSNTSTPSK